MHKLVINGLAGFHTAPMYTIRTNTLNRCAVKVKTYGVASQFHGSNIHCGSLYREASGIIPILLVSYAIGFTTG